MPCCATPSCIIALAVLAMSWSGVVYGQSKARESIVESLKHGGYVLVMRHASSPRDVPSKQTANPDNVKLERQLDENGRRGAIAMGQTLRDRRIPIGEVLSSPTYRAMETVRFAQLPTPHAVVELGDGGQSMQGATDAQGRWLRDHAAQFPKDTNTFIVTHMPNISRAFPEWGAVADGETVVVGPDGHGGATVVTRILIDDWPRLQ